MPHNSPRVVSALVTYRRLLHCHSSCAAAHSPRHGQFIIILDLEISRSKSLPNSRKIWSVHFVSMSMETIAQTDSKYGLNTCIGIYLFYFRLDFLCKNYHGTFHSLMGIFFQQKYYLFAMNIYQATHEVILQHSNKNLSIIILVCNKWPDMCSWSIWDLGTKSKLLLINCQTAIDMSFLNIHALCYKAII